MDKVISQEQAKRLMDSLSCCYNAIGSDAFDSTVSDKDFECVLRDQIRTHIEICDQCSALPEDLDAFFAAPLADARDLIFRVGP